MLAPERDRAPLPDGTVPVAAALVVAGIATYAFFKVGEEAMGSPEAFRPIVSMWFATFALAPGFFLPLEQELGRALADRRARNEGAQPVITKVVRLGVALVVAIVLAVAVISPLLATNYFDGNWVMVLALIGAFAAYGPAHLARGICSGSGRFRDYALILGADGIVRIIFCIALAVIGVRAAGAFGLAIAGAPLVAVGWVWYRRGLRSEPGPPAAWGEVTQNLGWLLIGSVFAAFLLNAGPIAASILAADEQDSLVTQFSYGVLLARIPLFMFQAVQAALLPKLSRLAANGELGEFAAGFKRLMLVVLAVGVVGTVGAFVIGPFVLDVVYDAELSGGTLAALALSSAFYMLALATAQAVIALRGHALVALGWGAAAITFLLATWLSSDELFLRVEIGLLASSLIALVSFAGALAVRLAGHVEEPDEAAIIEAMTDMPLES